MFARNPHIEMKTKSIIITVLLAFSALTVTAQPRALGARIGATGFDVSYQHTLGNVNFIQTDLSLDFGYGASSAPGIKGTAIYNFVVARPAWTQKGTWALYTGPGLSLGYVQDKVNYRSGNYIWHPYDYGFMLAVAVQAGLEYTFEFPLQISVDIRPYFGMHVNGDITRRIDRETEIIEHKGKTGYYNGGWYGFIPTLSLRYRF